MLPFVLTILTGTALGSVLEVLYPGWALWQNAVFRQGMGLMGTSFWELMGCAFLGLAILAAFGLSVIGALGAYAVLLCRGMALGAVLAELYVRDGFAGLLTGVLFVMPYAFGAVLVLLLAARETCRCAGCMAACLAGNEEAERFSGGLYVLRFVVLAALLLLLTGAQSALLRFAYPAFLHFMVNRS